MGFVDVEVETKAETSNDEGDHDRFSHYVRKDQATESMVMGTPITALCGKVWVPSRDPDKYKICPTCKELYELLSSNGS